MKCFGNYLSTLRSFEIIWFDLRTSTFWTSRKNIFSRPWENRCLHYTCPCQVSSFAEEVDLQGWKWHCLWDFNFSCLANLIIEIASECAKLSESALYSSLNLWRAPLATVKNYFMLNGYNAITCKSCRPDPLCSTASSCRWTVLAELSACDWPQSQTWF